MPYCPRCGVEVSSSERACPLCEYPLELFDSRAHPDWPRPDPSRPSRLNRSLVTRRALGLFSGIVIVAATAVALVDGAGFGRVTWSAWPLASLAWLWTVVASGLLLRRSVAAGVTIVSSATLLAVFDSLSSPSLDWFLDLGLPLEGLAVVVVAALRGIWRRWRGWNAAAATSAIVGAALPLIDALIHRHLTAVWRFGWSAITDGVFVPLTLLFLLLHAVYRDRADFFRFFRF